jgi:hypothetical protein
MNPTSKKDDCLYFIQSRATGYIKIGRSKDPHKRLKALQTGSPNELRLVAYFQGLGWRERVLHERLARWRVQGEWFDPACVGSIPEDIYEQIPWGALDEWWKK